jgi:hypothetical protein
LTDGAHFAQIETLGQAWRKAGVLNIQAMTVMHRHGDDWGEMRDVTHTNPDAHDPERQLVRGARIFRCDVCDEEIQIVPPDNAA